jgi:hypothetical protein
MMVFDVVADIQGATFVALLTELGRNADTIGFVVQGDMAAEAKQLLDQIESAKISDSIQQSWPGTTLLDGFGRVLEYHVNASVLDTLTNFTGGLFAWSKRSFPEDLFVKSGATILLESVGHERFAFVRSEEMTPLIRSLLNDGIIAVYHQNP